MDYKYIVHTSHTYFHTPHSPWRIPARGRHNAVSVPVPDRRATRRFRCFCDLCWRTGDGIDSGIVDRHGRQRPALTDQMSYRGYTYLRWDTKDKDDTEAAKKYIKYFMMLRRTSIPPTEKSHTVTWDEEKQKWHHFMEWTWDE